MKSRIAFLIWLCLLPMMAFPSWQKWLIHPEYDWIGYYSEEVFKCVKDGKVQLYDMEGHALLPSPADSVTDYSYGYALVLSKEKRGYRIDGTLSEKDLAFCAIDKPYYTERFTYCSEGFISVADAQGKQGYIDTKGFPIIRCQFREARPYRKGWASVSLKEGEAHYIDAYGNTLPIKVKVTDATSFNMQGEALIGNYQKLLIINTSGEIVRKYTMQSGQVEPPVRPYDYVYDEDWKHFEPERNKQPYPDSRYQWKSENGRWGIMVTHEGDFSATLTPDALTLVPGQAAPEMTYTLILPSGFGQDYSLFFDNGDGVERLVTPIGNKYTFTPTLERNANSVTIRSRLMSGGMLQWQDEKTVPLQQEEARIEVGQPYCTSQYADANDTQRVKAVITNLSSFPVEVSSSIEVVLPSGSKNRVVSKSNPSRTLEPNEKIECLVTIKVVEEGWVKVVLTATHDGRVCGNSEATMTLRPFY